MTALYQAWIEAGGDAARFWGMTPKLFSIEIAALHKRDAQQRAGLAEAVFVGTRSDADGLRKYIDALMGIDRTLPPEVLDRALARAERDLPKMSWAEFRAGRMN